MAESLPGGAPPNTVPVDPNAAPMQPYTPPPAPAGSSYWQKVASFLPHGRSITAPDPAQRAQMPVAPPPATQLQYTDTTPKPEPSRIPVAAPARTIAAHEVDTAGPTLRRAWENQENVQRHSDEAAGDRNQAVAREGQDVYQAQMDQAAAREKEIKAQTEAQTAGLDAQRADFDKASSDAAKVQIDNDRLWNKKSFAQKAMFHLANVFSGLGAGATGGVNQHMKAWQEMQAADVAAQKHHYDALRGRVGDMQTAYSMGMQKYQNANAAREFANAAHAEAAKAAIGKLAERYKGTEAANTADQKIADLEELRANHVRAGTKYVQAQTVGGAGALTAAQRFELQKMALEHGYKVDEAKVTAGNRSEKETAESQRNLSKDLDETGAPAFDAAMSQINDIAAAHGGKLPGTSLWDRGLKKVVDANIPGVSNIADWQRGSDARQVDGATKQIAEAQAHASGQRGTEAIEYNRHILEGTQSAADREAGFARAKAIVDARRREALAGYDQATIDLHNKRKGQ